MTKFLRIELPLVMFLFLAILIPALTHASGPAPARGSDSNSHGAPFTHSSDEGLFGFKFSLHTVDGSPLHTVEDEYGVKYAKLVIGKKYRVTGKVPLRLVATSFTHLVLEHQAVGEDTWDAIHKFKLPKKQRFDQTFTLPQRTHSRGHWRLRSFNDEGLEGTEDALPVVSGLLGTDADIVVSINITNDAKDDLLIRYPTQQLNNDTYCTSTITLPAGETATTTYTNPKDWGGMTWWATRVNAGLIVDKYKMRWDHTVPGYTACSTEAAGLQLQSGQVYNMRLTPRSLSSGFDAFVWGANFNFPVCSGGFLTNAGYDIADHTAQFIETYLSDLGATVATIGMAAMCAGAPELTAPCYAEIGLVSTDINKAQAASAALTPDLPPSCP